MKSKKIKTLVVWLLMVVVVRFGTASQPELTLERYIDEEMYIVGDNPKIGEIFEVVYRITVKATADWTERKSYLTHNYAAVIRGPAEALEIIGQDKFFFSGLKIGETKEFRVHCRILKSWNWIQILGSVELVYQGKIRGAVAGKAGIPLYLLDPETGQYGTKEEYEGKLPVEHRYDPVDGSFTCSPDQNPAPVEENRRIIKMIKELEPRLSDSLALLLHSDQYRVEVPKGLPRWDEENKRWLEEEVFEYYLKDGWFEALQKGKREGWIIQEREKIMKEVDKHKLNFFRPDNNNNHSGNYNTDRFYKDFYGQWWYKDHIYNKDQGLLATAVKRPIKNGKARLLMTYMYNSVYYRVLTDYDVTDDSGYFCITFDIPQGAIGCKAYPVIYPSGPYPAVPMVNVSDPNIAQPDYWKDIDDPTLFIMRELGVPTYHDFYANGLPCTLGVIWTDTFPQVSQPQSGCINIYETYLHARTITPEEPTWPLRVMWEPGYDSTTGYRLDTIWVIGEPSAPIADTDEWDDDVLLHEFGHYLMDKYAEIPPGYNPLHQWYLSDSMHPNVAYLEGWAYFFSGRARVGTITDSLHINNRYIGSGNAKFWMNFEDAWIGSEFTPAEFQGGPYCEGAVCGSLWDIYDSKDEIPYPSYPDSLHGVWYPDTALADSLTMDFDTIWTVFDDYNPPGERTHCWTIFDFRSGWNFKNYDHEFALNQILLHHRIQDSIPAAPTGLGAELDNNYNVDLCWYKNSEPDLNGYRVYRRSKCLFVIPPQWSSWGIIVENSSPTDTTHLDTTVQRMYRYEYKLTAYDSLGNESEFSDSVRIDVIQKDMDKNSPPFVRNSVIKDIRQLVLVVPEGSHVLIVKIYDCTGRVIERQELTFEKGFSGSVNICNRRGKNLPSGVYFVDIQNDNDLRVVEKIVIIK